MSASTRVLPVRWHTRATFEPVSSIHITSAHTDSLSQGTCTREYGSECPTFLQLMDPRTSTNFTIHHEGILYGLLFIALLAERYALGFGWATVTLSLLMSAVIGSVGSALHSSFHVRGFQLEKYEWYLELRALHYIHHLGTRCLLRTQDECQLS